MVCRQTDRFGITSLSEATFLVLRNVFFRVQDPYTEAAYAVSPYEYMWVSKCRGVHRWKPRNDDWTCPAAREEGASQLSGKAESGTARTMMGCFSVPRIGSHPSKPGLAVASFGIERLGWLPFCLIQCSGAINVQ